MLKLSEYNLMCVQTSQEIRQSNTTYYICAVKLSWATCFDMFVLYNFSRHTYIDCVIIK